MASIRLSYCWYYITVLCYVVGYAASMAQQPPQTLRQHSASTQSTAKQRKAQSAASHRTVQYETYTGKWYTLQFPAGWHVRPSLRGADSADDSVFFTAPDSSAEFYVYCPRYTGKPEDIEIHRLTEDQLGQTIEEKEGVRIRTVRIKAKDDSYMRVFEDTIAFIVGRRLVFGFKFRDDATRIQYNPAYVHFKSSFRKFAD